MRALLIATALASAGCAMKYRDNILCDRPVPLKAAHVTVIPDGYSVVIHYRNGMTQRVSGAACVLDYDAYSKSDRQPAEKK